MFVLVMVTVSIGTVPIGVLVLIGHESSLTAMGPNCTLQFVRNGQTQAVAGGDRTPSIRTFGGLVYRVAMDR